MQRGEELVHRLLVARAQTVLRPPSPRTKPALKPSARHALSALLCGFSDPSRKTFPSSRIYSLIKNKWGRGVRFRESGFELAVCGCRAIKGSRRNGAEAPPQLPAVEIVVVANDEEVSGPRNMREQRRAEHVVVHRELSAHIKCNHVYPR